MKRVTAGARVHFDKHRTLEETAYQYLRAAITSGELAPGMKLVGSRLALELNVSRITISNALKRLTSEGFVNGTPHHEATVAALDEASLREIFLMRYALEDVVMPEAARRVTPTIIAQLHVLDARLSSSIVEQDQIAYRRLEREYHLLIYGASGLPMITALLTDCWDRLEPYRRRRYSNLGLTTNTLAEHRAILSALEAHDSARLIAAMHTHVDHGYERFRTALGIEPSFPAAHDHAATIGPARGRANEAPAGSLRAALETLPDARRGQGKVHLHSGILTLAVCAVLCGARSSYAVAMWGQQCHPAIRSIVGLDGSRGPSIATVYRVFKTLDQAAFVRVLYDWFEAHGMILDRELSTPGPGRPHKVHGSLASVQLPGLPLLTRVAGQIHASFARTLPPNAQSTATNPTSSLETFSLQLLVGQTVMADALVAQRELCRQILRYGGGV